MITELSLKICSYKIMQDCWQENPDDRPTFEILRDELKEMENQHQVIINTKKAITTR